MDSRKTGLALFIGGGAVAVIGAVLWAASRSSQKRLGDNALTKTSKKADGMKLTHYSHPTMPIKKRIALLQDLTWKSVQDPRMRKIALQVTSNCPGRDTNCETRAIYDAIKRRVRYTGDVAPIKMGANGPTEGIDLFQSAYRTWDFAGGDCDDHSVLAATLLTLNGIQARFRVTAKNPDPRSSDWSHIYAIAGTPKNNPAKWVPIDTTVVGEAYNYDPPHGKRIDFTA